MKLFPVTALLLFLAAAPLRPVWSQETAEPGHLSKAEAPGVTNLSLLEDSTSFAGALVGFGGATEPEAFPWLEGSGFKTVINLRLSTETGANVDSSRIAAAASDLHYIHLPFNGVRADSALIDRFTTAAGDEQNQPVYIHCSSATRVAALWMIARVLADGWDLEAAAEEARAIAGKPEKAINLAEKYLGAHELDH